MRRRPIEEKVILLYIFAVIPLLIGQAKHPLFEERILFIPQCHTQAEILLVITKATQAVFVPAISPAAGMVVRKIVPGIPIYAVIFAHRTPGALTEVRSPAPPIGFARLVFCQAPLLGVGGHLVRPCRPQNWRAAPPN